jgi:phospholipid/cholesterol/gamma-HCH transport system substrate-binding protein
METRAHFVLIGAFTLAVAAAALAFVFWFAGVGRFSNRLSYQVVFSGSVSGLSNGSVVLFNGVRVGEVQAIVFLPNDPSHVAATAIVDNGTPIRADTKARLELQGLTGAAAIALTGGAADSPPTRPFGDFQGRIVAEPSQLQNILENVQQLTTKSDSALNRINALIDANGPNVTSAIANIAGITKSLNGDGSGVSGALKSLGDLSNSLSPSVQGLQKVIAHVDDLVSAVDPKDVKAMVADAGKFSKALGDNSDNVATVLGQLAAIAKSLDPVVESAKGLVATLDKMAEAIDMNKVDSVIDNAQAFSSTLNDVRPQVRSSLIDIADLTKKLDASSASITGSFAGVEAAFKAIDPQKVASIADGAASFAEVLKANRDNIDSFVKDSTELSKKLNASADKLDGLINSVSGLSSGDDGKNTIAQVGAAAASVRALADEINKRVKEIAPGLAHFTGSGLREYEGLAADGRRAIGDVDRVVKGFEKNPSQLIFGAKPGLPEYHGGP